MAEVIHKKAANGGCEVFVMAVCMLFSDSESQNRWTELEATMCKKCDPISHFPEEIHHIFLKL